MNEAGPIIKDAVYFGFWAFVLTCGLMLGGGILWILIDIRDVLKGLVK